MLMVVVGEWNGMQSSCWPALMPALFVVIAPTVSFLTEKMHPFPTIQIPKYKLEKRVYFAYKIVEQILRNGIK